MNEKLLHLIYVNQEKIKFAILITGLFSFSIYTLKQLFEFYDCCKIRLNELKSNLDYISDRLNNIEKCEICSKKYKNMKCLKKHKYMHELEKTGLI